jgi:hypothetical protein
MILVTLLDALYNVPQLTVRIFSIMNLLFCNARSRISANYAKALRILMLNLLMPL